MIKLSHFVFIIVLSFTTVKAQETFLENTKTDAFEGKSIKIISWNIQDLGRSKTQDEIQRIAEILRNYDLVAIQEVVAKDPEGAQSVAKIADELNRMGSKWDYRISDPTQSPSVYMSERYAYLWKTSVVTLLSKPYLDQELALTCAREPYIAKFKTKNGTEPFYLINFHARTYNDRPQDELKHFAQYPQRLATKRCLILGDFNLSETHQVWNDLYHQGFDSALKNTPTTLKKECKDGDYTNHSMDNIYFHPSEINKISSGVINLVQDCSNLANVRTLSDHLPIFMECQME